MRPGTIFALVGLLLLLAAGGAVFAQSDGVQDLVELRVDAGYDGHFRDLEWLPVRVRLTNNGPDLTGSLVVRPETSGEGITNTFSVPVTLTSGAQQTAWLYVTARTFADQVRVDLLTDAGAVVSSANDSVRAVRPGDRIGVVFTDSAAGATDLSGLALGGFNTYQAEWTVEELPPDASALAGIDLMLFDDVDTGALSVEQRDALTTWVRAGGHLIGSGGAAWQATSAGLTELLPLIPDDAQTTDTLQPIADWLVAPGAAIDRSASIATGDLTEDAQVLVRGGDDAPLIVRRFEGNGVVDFLAPDPNAAPLNGWPELPSLWFALETSRGPVPGWSHGFENWAQAQQSVSIIPGVDPLPDILPLALFLLAYVLVVGPLNYFLLARLNRRDWAWVTIPLSIAGFSVLAWLIGSNLRGTDPILNQLVAVESWAGEDTAVADGLTGLLSPRRAQYTLDAGAGDTLRPIPLSLETGTLLVRGAQASVNIEQRAAFAALDFAVDSSFVAGFNQTGSVAPPAVGGLATLSYEPTIAGQMLARGAVRNDSDQTLRSPVVLGRGVAVQLDDLEPGGVAPFELVLAGTFPAGPSPYLPSTITPYLTFRTARGQNLSDQTAADMLGAGYFDSGARVALDDPEVQERLRNQLFISSLVDDSFDSTGRGDRLFVAGWMDGTPLETAMRDQEPLAMASTLVISELETRIEPPGETVTVSTDRFTWAVVEYAGLSEVAPIDLNMQPGEEVSFRFTPLPTAVLDSIEQVSVVLDNLNVASRRVPLYLYDWQADEWVSMDVGREGLTISDGAERFLGPQNAVQVRLVADEIGGFLRIGALGVTQRGTIEGVS